MQNSQTPNLATVAAGGLNGVLKGAGSIRKEYKLGTAVSPATAARIYSDFAAMNGLARPAQLIQQQPASNIYYRAPNGQLLNTSQAVLAQLGLINPLGLGAPRFATAATALRSAQLPLQQQQQQQQQQQINLQNTINLQNHLATLAAFGQQQQQQQQQQFTNHQSSSQQNSAIAAAISAANQRGNSGISLPPGYT